MKILLLLIAIILTGCAEGNKIIEPCPHYNRLQVASFNGTDKPTPKPYKTVVPFYSQSEVKVPFKRIAFMSCEGDIREEAAILKAMLYRAADLGADAVLLDAPGIGQEEPQGNTQRFDVNIRRGAGWISMIGNSDHRCIYRAQAIVYQK